MVSVDVSIRSVERLVSRCEDIFGHKIRVRGENWRISKYVESLAELISDIETNHTSNIDVNQLTSFKQRLLILQEVVKEKIINEKKALFRITDHIPLFNPSHSDACNSRGSDLIRRSISSREKCNREELIGKV
jgi:hypothetical protein